jgi:endonuclease III-like uncharacterized protein
VRKLLEKRLSDVIKDGEFEYFKKYKALFSASEWPEAWRGLFEKAKKEKWDRNDIYVKMLIAESSVEELLIYCKERPRRVTDLYSYLVPRYKDDVGFLFLSLIESGAKRVSTRGGYQEVCGLIKLYKKACGKAKAEEIVLKLKTEHSRQPAFLDELSRV